MPEPEYTPEESAMPAAEPSEAAEEVAVAAAEPTVEASTPEELPPETKQWYIIHTYSGFERKVAESLRTRAEAFGFDESDRPDSDSGRRSGRAAQRQEGHQQAAALSRLRRSPDGYERRAVAPRERYAARHRLRRRRQTPVPLSADEINKMLYRQTTAAERPRPKMTFEKNESVRIIDGPVRELPGQGGRDQSGAQYAARAGHDFRPRDSGGAGLPAGREDLISRKVKERLWQRKLLVR